MKTEGVYDDHLIPSGQKTLNTSGGDGDEELAFEPQVLHAMQPWLTSELVTEFFPLGGTEQEMDYLPQ